MTKTEDNPMHLKMGEPSRFAGTTLPSANEARAPCSRQRWPVKSLPNAWRRGRQCSAEGKTQIRKAPGGVLPIVPKEL